MEPTKLCTEKEEMSSVLIFFFYSTSVTWSGCKLSAILKDLLNCPVQSGRTISISETRRKSLNIPR